MTVIINPGTEPQTNHNEQNAVSVAKTICKDLGIPENSFHREPTRDSDGWYGFVFSHNDKNVDVDIPGVEPERVCKGEAWVSPRLYVDGSSWLYGYALGSINDRINGVN